MRNWPPTASFTPFELWLVLIVYQNSREHRGISFFTMAQSKRLKNYIRSARKRAGLTQDELAYLLGRRGGKAVSRYEMFEREPMLPTAMAFEVALGVPAHELFARAYEDARDIVQHRARVMDIQLRKKPASRAVERKRQTIQRIFRAKSEGAASAS